MENILLDVPEEILTPRLRLRGLRIGDSAIINPAIVESAKELAQWMPWAVPTPSVADTEKWARGGVSKIIARQAFHFLMFLEDSEDYLGTCSINRVDWKTPCIEIGYWLRTSRHGHGYMTEAVRAVTELGFKTFECNRVEIRCDAENGPSRRVAERAGFKLEGTFRKFGHDHHDRLRDLCIYAKLRGE